MILAAMVLPPNFYCKSWLQVISAMRGNTPLDGRVVRSFEIQVAKATNGQTNGSAEENTITWKLNPTRKRHYGPGNEVVSVSGRP